MNYYNQFFKDEFLSTISEENRTNFRSLFRRSKQLEEQLNKDLYNFTDKFKFCYLVLILHRKIP